MNEYITTPTVEGASSFFKSIDLQTDERTSLGFFQTETYKMIPNLSNEQGEQKNSNN
jgi:hypothetical protein